MCMELLMSSRHKIQRFFFTYIGIIPIRFGINHQQFSTYKQHLTKSLNL